ADLLVEQGRGELLAGRHQSAATLLAQAYEIESTAPSPTLLFLVRSAMQAVEGEVLRIDTGASRVDSIAYSPDGNRLLILAADANAGLAELQIWDARTGRRIGAFGKAGYATWSPDGSTVLAAVGASLRTLDATTGAVRAEITLAIPAARVAVASDGK